MYLTCPYCNGVIGPKDLCKNKRCPSKRFTVGNLVYAYGADNYGTGIIISTKTDVQGFGQGEVYPKYIVSFSLYNLDGFYAKEIRHLILSKDLKVRYIKCFDIDIDAIITAREKNKTGIQFGIIDDVVIDSNSEIIKYHVITETGSRDLLYEFEILDVVPETITLFGSSLSGIQNFFLSLWANQIQTQYSSTSLKMVNNSRLYLYPHQVTVAYRLLMKYQPRMILADEVGLGKTIEAGLFISEMVSRQLMRKILIVAPANLLTQWQFELKNKFNIEAIIYTGKTAKDIVIDHSQDILINTRTGKKVKCVIVSIQYARLKKPKAVLTQINWDLVIFDEAHHLRRYKTRKTLAYSFAELIALKSKSLLLLSATPVQLNSYELYSLIELLYPKEFDSFEDFEIARASLKDLSYLINNLINYNGLNQFEKEQFPHLLKRYEPQLDIEKFPKIMNDPRQIGDIVERLKQRNFLSKYIIRNRRKTAFPNHKIRRIPKNVSVVLTEQERHLYEALRVYVVRVYSLSLQNENNAGTGFLAAIFLKMITSSPYALLNSLNKRIALIEKFDQLLLKLKVLANIEDEDDLLDNPALASLLDDIEERKLFNSFVKPKKQNKPSDPEDLADSNVIDEMDSDGLDYLDSDETGDYDDDFYDDNGNGFAEYDSRDYRYDENLPSFLTEGFNIQEELNVLKKTFEKDGIAGLKGYLTKDKQKLLKYPKIQRFILSQFVSELSNLKTDSKLEKLGEIVDEIFQANPNEKVIIFVQFKDTLRFIKKFLLKKKLKVYEFHGDLNIDQKNESVAQFKDQGHVLLSTEIGGEGRNFQFCHILINYDLPWNPMKLEQRIGRLDRIGQQKDVLVYNFFIEDSIESEILKVITERILLFEESVGSLEPILEKVEDNITKLVLSDKSDYELQSDASQIARQRNNEIDTMKFQLRNFVLDERIFSVETIQEHIQELDLFNEEDLFLFTVWALNYLDKNNEFSGSKSAKDGIIKFKLTKGTQSLLLLDHQSYYGTFDLDLAKQKEEIDFFAMGHDLIKALATEFASFKFRGRTSRFKFNIDDKLINEYVKNDDERKAIETIKNENQKLYLFNYLVSYTAVAAEKQVIPIVVSEDSVYLSEFSRIFLHPVIYINRISAEKIDSSGIDDSDYENKIKEIQKITIGIINPIIKQRVNEIQSLNDQYYNIELDKIHKAIQFNIKYADQQIELCNKRLEVKSKQLPTDEQINRMEKLKDESKKEQRRLKFQQAQNEYDMIIKEIDRWKQYIEDQHFDLPGKIKRLEQFKKIKKNIDLIQIAEFHF